MHKFSTKLLLFIKNMILINNKQIKYIYRTIQPFLLVISIQKMIVCLSYSVNILCLNWLYLTKVLLNELTANITNSMI